MANPHAMPFKTSSCRVCNSWPMQIFRPYRESDAAGALALINAAAAAYRGAIPDDCWHEPYMPAEELCQAIRAGVELTVCLHDGVIMGIMGVQRVADVDLIRHAYVRPNSQRSGVGSALLRQLIERTHRELLVGTWAAASWAIEFYRRNGFCMVEAPRDRFLLRKYWSVPERQIASSVVLEYRASLPGLART